MSSQRHHTRRLSWEQLEDRQLMAGDLHAALVAGDLMIGGGPLSNGVQITAGPTPGTVQVSGLRQAGFATQINHQNAPLTFKVSGDVVIDLGDGDNRVKIDNVCLPGKLNVLCGDGGDTIEINCSAVARSLTLKTGAGNDRVELVDTAVRGPLEARLRSGDDYFSMLGCQVSGDMELEMGFNADRVNVRDSRFGGNLGIRSDSVFAPSRITLANVQVREELAIETGDGDDQIHLCGVSARQLAIETHAGDDHVHLEWVTVDHLRSTVGSQA